MPFYAAIAALTAPYDHAAYVSLSQAAGARSSATIPRLAVDRCPAGHAARRGGPAPERDPAPLQAPVTDAAPVRPARRHGRALGRRHGAALLHPLLPAPARGRRDRLLVALPGRALRGAAPRRRGRHPVRARRCATAGCAIAKAEGRPVGVQGSVYHYRLADGGPELTQAPAAARLGGALRAVRMQRQLSQAQLAQLAEVSASAISQAERGQRGLSLETLLTLTANLNITVDELLRGHISPGYRLGRRDDPAASPTGTPVPLLDDPEAGLRAYLVRLAPGRDRDAEHRPQGHRARRRDRRPRADPPEQRPAGAAPGRGPARRPQRRSGAGATSASARRRCSGSSATDPVSHSA